MNSFDWILTVLVFVLLAQVPIILALWDIQEHLRKIEMRAGNIDVQTRDLRHL